MTSDGGLILFRELDERLVLQKLIEEHLSDSRQGLNKQFTLADLLRQSVYSRLSGCEDLSDAEPLAADPTFRLIGSQRIWHWGEVIEASSASGFGSNGSWVDTTEGNSQEGEISCSSS